MVTIAGVKKFTKFKLHERLGWRNLADGTYFVVLRVNYGNEEYEDHQGTLTIMRK